MFGNRRKQIADLTARVQRRTEQRDFHHSQADTAKSVQRIVAAKFTDAHTLCWDENARLNDQVDGYGNLLARHARLIRACARYRDEARLLKAAHRRELRAKADQLEAMQRVLDRYHARDFDEAKTGMEKSGLTALKPAA
jgi:hypothetical protein